MTAEYFIEQLQLRPHPEGGFYKQTYRSEEKILLCGLPKRFPGERPFSTAIYYLLRQGDFSAFHKIKSDECWHFYAGSAIYIYVIEPNGNYKRITLGNQIAEGHAFQCMVPAEAWFAVEPLHNTAFALTGCTVAPGFDFADFEMAAKQTLAKLCPQQKDLINRFCK